MSYGILLLRLAVGLTLAAHGSQKLFGWFGGGGLQGTAGFFGQIGFRSAGAMAFLAALAETSGLLFALGLVTPLAALGMSVAMLTAIGSVHWSKGFWVTAGGYEYNFVLIAVAVAVTMTGPGRFSLDRAFGIDDELSGLWWGVGVFCAALLLSSVTLQLFRAPRTTTQQQQPA
jgi:putative oxidoreductase